MHSRQPRVLAPPFPPESAMQFKALAALLYSSLAFRTVTVLGLGAARSLPHTDITYPDYDAIIVCSGLNCTGLCDSVSMGSLNTCYNMSSINYLGEYKSIMAYICPGCNYTFPIYMATAGCMGAPVQLQLNVRYNTSYGGELEYYQTYYTSG
ncbi:hypothetical protein SCP_1900420 [Sparassis crispa]|uniref:Uncharacterized protein n=1 Tax=Sparassis crispa TaxID=139825 RepID=A0A401H738_9APHY|nr:hypothetical protein SCP_1900420 [Sparassis crispa]GBE90193.1 hypothetical protein SCP_1900420 [Sparassis crispa]